MQVTSLLLLCKGELAKNTLTFDFVTKADEEETVGLGERQARDVMKAGTKLR